MIRIPSVDTKQWQQLNNGELFGNLYSTYNCNFDTEGLLKQSRAPISIYSNADDANFLTPLAFGNNGSNIYVLTEDGVFTVQWNVSDPIIEQVTTTDQPTFSQFSDGIMWNNNFYCAGGDLKYYTGSVWTDTGAGGGTTTPITLAVFESLNYLAMGYGSQVELYNDTHTLVETLVLPSEYWITSIRYRDQKLYIGTRHRYLGEAKLFVWNGNGAAAQSAYGVQSDWIFSITEYQSSIALVTKNGQLLRFNGGGFDSLANFPVYHTNRLWNYSDASSGSSYGVMGSVRNRGMIAMGDVLYINVTNEIRNQGIQRTVDGYYLDNMPSGVWCYDPKVKLYHYAGQTADKYTTYTASSLSDSTLTLSSDTTARTGDPVYVRDVGSLTGISGTTQWSGYIIKIASNQIRLTTTRANAFTGNYITLGGSVTSASIFIPTYKNGGNINGGKSSAIAVAQYGSLDAPADVFNSHLIYGASCSDSSTVTTSRTALNILTHGFTISRFVSQKAYSSDVTSAQREVTVKYNNLWLNDDEIIVKYRIVERLGMPTMATNNETAARAATWSSGTTFTVSEGTTYGTVPSLYQVEAGDECIITQGAGAPYSAHVSSISVNAGTWTIVLDETITGITAGNTCSVVFTNFKKLGVIDNTVETHGLGFSTLGFPSDVKGRYIQLAFELRGHEIGIEEVAVSDKVDRPFR